MAVVAWVERLNLKYGKVGNPPIYDNAVFPWTKTIERDWRAIRTELDHVLTRKDDLPGFHELSTDVAVISQDRGWKTFFLCGYGFRSVNNIKLCPQTRVACQNIPGLIVPEPREQLGIRVEKDVYRWREGEAVVFDDA